MMPGMIRCPEGPTAPEHMRPRRGSFCPFYRQRRTVCKVPDVTLRVGRLRVNFAPRESALQGRDLAQMLHRMIEVHQLVDLFGFDPQATPQGPDAIPDPTRPV